MQEGIMAKVNDIWDFQGVWSKQEFLIAASATEAEWRWCKKQGADLVCYEQRGQMLEAEARKWHRRILQRRQEKLEKSKTFRLLGFIPMQPHEVVDWQRCRLPKPKCKK